MPLLALSAKANEMVPVGAMLNKWLLRRPYWEMAALMASGRRDANSEAKYLSASNKGKRPFSRARSTEDKYAASRMTSEIRAAHSLAAVVS